MLPGRGSSDASYFQQFLIEKFHAMGQPYIVDFALTWSNALTPFAVLVLHCCWHP